MVYKKSKIKYYIVKVKENRIVSSHNTLSSAKRELKKVSGRFVEYNLSKALLKFD